MPALLISVVGALGSTVAPPPAVYAPSSDTIGESTCLPVKLSRDAQVIVLSMYGGRGERAYASLTDQGHETHLVKVTGSGRGKVALVLSAYEPTVWDVSAIRDRVAAVYASGYYPQAVEGLDRRTAARFNQVVNTGAADRTCRTLPYAYRYTSEILQMAALAGSIVGRHPSRFYGGYDPDRFDIDENTPGERDPRSTRNLRSGAPIIAMDRYDAPYQYDARYGYEARYRAARYGMAPGTATRFVAWDDSNRVVRNIGAPPPVRPYRSAYVPRSPRSSVFSGRTLFWWIVAGAIGLWCWRRLGAMEKSGEDQSEAVVADVQPGTAPEPETGLPVRTSAAHGRANDLTSLAAMTDCEQLVLALHRYGREMQATDTCALDADLLDEREAITGRHFDHAVSRYRMARPTLSGAEAGHADDLLCRALTRLASRLTELRDEQHQRDVDGIDEATRFIDSRHPV
jgi:hypothetical protein